MPDIQETKPPHEGLIDGELKVQQAQVPELNVEDAGKHELPVLDQVNLRGRSAEHDVRLSREGIIQRNWKQFKRLSPDSPLSRISGSYQPIFTLSGVALLSAGVLTARPLGHAEYMPQFIGLAIIFFTMLKRSDLDAFKADFVEFALIGDRNGVE